ncbi:NAD(P)H-binding protein [Actinomadura sp. NEAU-AAG7]|nr:NAD(P)H-binding protein [Actinomadura sp. NEAU-AAG7]MBT2212496.1 NAD(P)H-binding protein [Actinomadura sp. NEAU-AAG7]
MRRNRNHTHRSFRRAAHRLSHHRALCSAVEGADALFLLLAGDLLGGGAPATEVLDVAGAGGVRRVVLLSFQIHATRPDAPSYARLREFEEAVRSSGLDWTILRAGGFASNAHAWAESVRRQRTVVAPFGSVALPVVDPADIAEAAAMALRDEGHAGQTYELTGPTAITPRCQAAALGEKVRFVELTREQAREHMALFMPEPVIDGTLDILAEPRPEEQRGSPDIEKLLGRPANAFTDWAARNRPHLQVAVAATP